MPANFAVAPEHIEQFVLQAVAAKRRNLANLVQNQFGVSRATAHNYLRALVRRGLIVHSGRGIYELARSEDSIFADVKGLEEHAVWEDKIQPLLKGLPPNAVNIWHYGCTEMINNVIDHSESATLRIKIARSAQATDLEIHDEGVGIFRKIARALKLDDDRHSVLELSKGKVTTDPANHTGEGIYFSSRAFDEFKILSGGVLFERNCDDEDDWILADERPIEHIDGTSVYMTLSNATERELQGIFDEYATDIEDYRFDKTIVPVKLLQYGDDRLVSRSQAKRLLDRFDRFRTVVLNYEKVESIGQAFADEVFRVFPSQHPEVEIIPINANEQVTRMMRRAISERQPQTDLFPERIAADADEERRKGQP